MHFSQFLHITIAVASLAPWHAAICQSQPPLQITAGAVVSSQLECPPHQNTHCEAVLHFSDPNFLPYVVNVAGDDQCPTDHACVAEFIVPPGSPNGPATLFWLCTGQTASACFEVEISQGHSDAESLRHTSSGTIQCEPISPSKSATTSTTATSPATIASSGTLFPTPTQNVVIPIDRAKRYIGGAR